MAIDGSSTVPRAYIASALFLSGTHLAPNAIAVQLFIFDQFVDAALSPALKILEDDVEPFLVFKTIHQVIHRLCD